MRSRANRTSRLAATLCASAGVLIALAGCGKSAPIVQTGGSVETVVVKRGSAGTAATATRNTTRLGGSNAIGDAAAVARAAYPGLTEATRPQAVVVADSENWPDALAASTLASSPLGAPLLYSQGGSLPEASSQALSVMHPSGASTLGGAQVILLGSSIETPSGYRTRAAGASNPYSLAVSVAQLMAIVRGSSPHAVIVVAADGPPALAMPAAGLAAQSGAPILYVTKTGLPAATAAELKGLGHPTIYTVGTSAIAPQVLSALGRLGRVRRVEAKAGEDATPAGNAIAVSRYSEGSFGWGVVEPGHGLAFANATRPFDAPAAAILSATGDYAPLLLLESADRVGPLLASYLADIQPAAPRSQPVKGVYNHGWLIGDEGAISSSAQAELDGMLEISPSSSSSESGQASEEPAAE